MPCVRPILLASVLLLAPASPVRSQPPAPLAFVGVRIVDGSGNEPFTGTVVVEGGRIREAGRSVEPPSGATIIDGTGRTLLPGLVDVAGVTEAALPPATRRRALARLLAAGVTTAVAPRSAPGLSGAEAPRVDQTPRLITLGEQVLALRADVPDGDAQAAEARSRGQRIRVEAAGGETSARVLAWQAALMVGRLDEASVRGLPAGASVTIAPDLADAPPSVTQVIAAVMAARLRLAWASFGTAATLESPHASLVAMTRAGVSPLAAVTAATSGGAWGLGLQSDRGFLAPGMRADLLLVDGDPTTTIGDLSRIAQIYLGGVPVDRGALARAAAEPVVTPPTPEPSAAATSGPGTAGSARVAPPAAPVESARGARRREARERAAAAAAAKAARTAAAAPTPEAASAASVPTTSAPAADAPATEAPAASAPATEAPVPKAPALPAPPLAAPVVPARAGREPASLAPTAPPAASTDTAALGTAAEPSPSPAAPLADPLLDDFEHGDDKSAAGPGWVAAVEDGARPTTIVMGRVVKGLRDHALLVSARMGSGEQPFARASLTLAVDGRPMDVSRFRGLRFDARGEGRYRIVFVTRRVDDGRYHESYFSGSPLWTPVSVPFASTGQNGAGRRVQWTGRDLVEIRFELTRDPGRIGWLELDNVRLY